MEFAYWPIIQSISCRKPFEGSPFLQKDHLYINFCLVELVNNCHLIYNYTHKWQQRISLANTKSQNGRQNQRFHSYEMLKMQNFTKNSKQLIFEIRKFKFRPIFEFKLEFGDLRLPLVKKCWKLQHWGARYESCAIYNLMKYTGLWDREVVKI